MLDAFDVDALDAIITNAAGCGSHLKHYSNLLSADPDYAERAKAWDAKVRDINEWLVEIDFRKPTADSSAPPTSRCTTYHEACHLCHGQGISSQPREILRAVPGLQLVEMKDATNCCGSAGVYNITQPEQAEKLQREKVGNIAATAASVVVTANPGCHLQIENGCKGAGMDSVSVRHPASMLAEAYRAEKQGGDAGE